MEETWMLQNFEAAWFIGRTNNCISEDMVTATVILSNKSRIRDLDAISSASSDVHGAFKCKEHVQRFFKYVVSLWEMQKFLCKTMQSI